MKLEDLEVEVYRIDDQHTVERRGLDAWVVFDGLHVLRCNGTGWEYEPRPSNRTEDFKERTRFYHPQVALKTFEAGHYVDE